MPPSQDPEAGRRQHDALADRRCGWEDQEQLGLEASMAATPAQRLEWLEEALALAWASGALPRREREDPADSADGADQGRAG